MEIDRNQQICSICRLAFGAFTPATLVPEINHTAMEFGINEHISLYEKLNKLNFKVKPVNTIWLSSPLLKRINTATLVWMRKLNYQR